MKVVWTKKAQKRFIEILAYIEFNFGHTARRSFKTKTKDFTDLLDKFPEIGTVEIPEKKIRGF
ncbi:type II toxin-antitoxin system RelE/ParE family toxin [Cyclobacterium sp. 1_MG-2023]|uniref:type II toxin-antitoxin system RelE/ParE family toxin n=1 Tax=Cyclobacterium sp. 1_MG-2023 TaxID=3062681 RepID=UPI0034C6778C